MGVRRVLKKDMKRIAKACGAQIVSSLSNMEGDEVFEASSLGQILLFWNSDIVHTTVDLLTTTWYMFS